MTVNGRVFGRAVVSSVCAVILAAGLGARAGADTSAAPEKTWAGTVLSSTELVRSAWPPAASQAREIRYATPGPQGERASSHAAVYLPQGATPKGGWPVVVFLHGTAGLRAECADFTTPRAQRAADYARNWLTRGYALVYPDYPEVGPRHLQTYLDYSVAGSSIADAVRAARSDLSRDGSGSELSNRYVATGLSEGAHGAVGAAAVAAEHAPDLDLRGVAGAGLPTNLDAEFAAVRPGLPVAEPNLASYVLYTLSGLRQSDPTFDPEDFLSPTGRKFLARAESGCFDDLVGQLQGVSVGSLVSRALDAPAVQQRLRKYVDLPTSGYRVPVQIAQGGLDIVAPAPLTAVFAEQVRRSGVHVDYRLYPDADHSRIPVVSQPDTIAFTDRVMSADARQREESS